MTVKQKNTTNQELVKKLENTRQVYKKILFQIVKADENKIYPIDIVLIGTIQRSLQTIDSYVLLIKEQYYYSAASLIRLHLDTLLQLYAYWLVEDPNHLATKIMRGNKRTKDFRDKSNNLLTDNYLNKVFFNDPANKEFDQIRNVYKNTSKFIHFSDKHIFASVEKLLGENTVQFRIASESEITITKKTELSNVMITISKAQFKYLIGWIATKDKKND